MKIHVYLNDELICKDATIPIPPAIGYRCQMYLSFINKDAQHMSTSPVANIEKGTLDGNDSIIFQTLSGNFYKLIYVKKQQGVDNLENCLIL